MTVIRTATCHWRTTRVNLTPPHTPLTVRMRRGLFLLKNAGKTWHPMWQRDHQHKVREPLNMNEYIYLFDWNLHETHMPVKGRLLYYWATFKAVVVWYAVLCFPDNGLSKSYWPGEYTAAAGSDSELKTTDRLRTESFTNSEANLRMLPEARTQESTTVQLPGLPTFNTHPHKST